MLATATLHLTGLASGFTLRQTRGLAVSRFAGAASAFAGVAILVGVI
jgi:hydrogenase/urease accessory protein HupE